MTHPDSSSPVGVRESGPRSQRPRNPSPIPVSNRLQGRDREPSSVRFEAAAIDVDEHAAGALIDGRYGLVEPIGVGGMGAVWKAHDEVLDIEVALKLVPPDRMAAVGRERLVREARAMAAIQDPGVVRVHGFGTHEGTGYIAMELLGGETLEDVLEERHRVSPEEAVLLLVPVVDALATAHRVGIIHRDIKPSNIMLVELDDGTIQPKLLDFGIARHDRGSSDNRLTCTGQVLGTPYYMAFEQASGSKDLDHRVDLWAACCVLYELVAGIGPFDGDNYNAVLRAVLIDPPTPLREHRPDADPEFWSILERGLRKEREERWQNMADLGYVLRRWLVQRGYRTDAAGRSLVRSDLPLSPPLESPDLEERSRPAEAAPAPSHGLAATTAAMLTAPMARGITPSAHVREAARAPHDVSRRSRAWAAAALSAAAIAVVPFATVLAEAPRAMHSDLSGVALRMVNSTHPPAPEEQGEEPRPAVPSTPLSLSAAEGTKTAPASPPVNAAARVRHLDDLDWDRLPNDMTPSRETTEVTSPDAKDGIVREPPRFAPRVADNWPNGASESLPLPSAPRFE